MANHTCFFCKKEIGDSEDNPISQYQFLETLELVDTCMKHRSEFIIPRKDTWSMSMIVEVMEEINKLGPNPPEDKVREAIAKVKGTRSV